MKNVAEYILYLSLILNQNIKSIFFLTRKRGIRRFRIEVQMNESLNRDLIFMDKS